MVFDKPNTEGVFQCFRILATISNWDEILARNSIAFGLNAFDRPNTWILKLAILTVSSVVAVGTVSAQRLCFFYGHLADRTVPSTHLVTLLSYRPQKGKTVRYLL